MFTSNDGYRLGLDASHVATSTSALPGGGISALINTALTYNSTSGTIDNNESTAGYGSFAAYVNSEIGKLDDVGFVQEGSDDAKLNIDYANDAAVLFNIPATGLMKLLIAEDAGLDPFKLEHCTGSAGSPTCTTLFNGWTNSGSGNVQSFLTSNGFGLDDVPNPSNSINEIDQAFLFVFDAPLTGFFRLSETTNPDYNSSKLEIDFIGGVTYAPAPEPGSFVVTGLGVAGLIWFARRRKPAQSSVDAA